MPSRNFEDRVKQFAEEQEKVDAENAVDWKAVKDDWIKAVRELFDQITGWLKPLIESGSLRAARSHISCEEQDLGPYKIEALELQLASKKMTFKPVGTVLIGAWGRIDVTGPTGKAALLLLNTDKSAPPKERRLHLGWFIGRPIAAGVVLPRTRPELKPLTEDSFEGLFEDLFGI